MTKVRLFIPWIALLAIVVGGLLAYKVSPSGNFTADIIDVTNTLHTDNLANHSGGATPILVANIFDVNNTVKTNTISPHTVGSFVTISNQQLKGGQSIINSYDYDYGGETAPLTSATNGLATGSTNTFGRMRPVAGQTTVTLTLTAPATTNAFCGAWIRGTGLIAKAVDVDDSAGATTGVITFTCFTPATGIAVDCPDLTYRCEKL